MTIGETLRWAYKLLNSHNVPAADLDAEVLLAKTLGATREYLFANSEQELKKKEQDAFNLSIHQRVAGVPVSHLLGKKEFFGLEFLTDENVLTPRPETEILVEKVLEELQVKSESTIIDIGTGSGCIAIAIRKNLPSTHRVYALDISAPALQVARKNSEKLKASDIHFLQSDLLSDVRLPENTAKPIVLVANLPYIPENEKLPKEVHNFDPAEALFAGHDGLEVYRRFLLQLVDGIRSTKKNIHPDMCFFEFHPPQQQSLETIFREDLPPYDFEFFADLASHVRFGFLKKI